MDKEDNWSLCGSQLLLVAVNGRDIDVEEQAVFTCV